MELAGDLVKYTYEDLNCITEGFSAENFIGNTRYGKVFRGKIQQGLETQVVTVKIWVDVGYWTTLPSLQVSRWKKEIKLLTDSDVKVHPNMVKLIGCCSENGQLGVVYDLQPINSLSNIVLQDDFKWIHRIKVALGFARLLDFLHDQGLWVHNITPNHLLVDQAFNPKLFDFSMLVGGGFGEISDHEREGGSAGYIDLHGAEIGDRSEKTDVFAYGAVLLGLITKTVYDGKEHFRLGLEHLICFWAWVEYNKKPKSKCLVFRSKKDIKDIRAIARTYWGVYKERKSKSLVHECLKSDPSFDAGDGVEITKLAIRCTQRSLEQRPTMKEVVSCLKNLKCFGDSHAMRI